MTLQEALEEYKIPYRIEDYIPPEMKVDTFVQTNKGKWYRESCESHTLYSKNLTVNICCAVTKRGQSITYTFTQIDTEDNELELKVTCNKTLDSMGIIAIEFRKNGDLHREEDLPARLFFEQNILTDVIYYKDDKLHREGNFSIYTFNLEGKPTQCQSYLNNKRVTQGRLPSAVFYNEFDEVQVLRRDSHNIMHSLLDDCMLGSFFTSTLDETNKQNVFERIVNGKTLTYLQSLDFFRHTPLFVLLEQ